MYYIYIIENEMNTKVYVGSAHVTPNIQFSKHKSDARNRPHSLLHKAMNEFGEDKFIIYELGTAETKEEARMKEAYHQILNDSIRTGYNKEYDVDIRIVLDMAMDLIKW